MIVFNYPKILKCLFKTIANAHPKILQNKRKDDKIRERILSKLYNFWEIKLPFIRGNAIFVF